MPVSISPPASVPRWARVLDIVCLLLLVVAAIVSFSGGFRVRTLGVWIGVTRPYPLLVWALAIGIGRHLFARQDPIYRALPRVLATLAASESVRAAVTTVAGTRFAMFAVGYLAVFMIGYAEGRAPLRHFNNELMNLPVRWDAGWYLDIVTDGYRYAPDQPDDVQQNIVFFPAYPMLIRAFGRLFGGHMTGYVVAGTALSLAAFFGALMYLFAFTRGPLGDDRARGAIWLLAAYPFAVFFGAIYTESLFLLGVLGAFYHFNRDEWGRAALWGVLVGLTRMNGALLAVPLAMLALSRRWSAASRRRSPGGWDTPALHTSQTLLNGLAAAAAPVAGLLLYAAFIWVRTGDPLAFVKGHVAWGRTYAGIGSLVAKQYAILANAGLSGYVANPGYDVLNAIGAIFAVVTIWPVARYMGAPYAVFMLANVLPALLMGGLLSAGRFSAVLFPAFVWLAKVIPTAQRPAWIASFVALQAYIAVLYYTWRPIF